MKIFKIDSVILDSTVIFFLDSLNSARVFHGKRMARQSGAKNMTVSKLEFLGCMCLCACVCLCSCLCVCALCVCVPMCVCHKIKMCLSTLIAIHWSALIRHPGCLIKVSVIWHPGCLIALNTAT